MPAVCTSDIQDFSRVLYQGKVPYITGGRDLRPGLILPSSEESQEVLLQKEDQGQRQGQESLSPNPKRRGRKIDGRGKLGKTRARLLIWEMNRDRKILERQAVDKDNVDANAINTNNESNAATEQVDDPAENVNPTSVQWTETLVGYVPGTSTDRSSRSGPGSGSGSLSRGRGDRGGRAKSDKCTKSVSSAGNSSSSSSGGQTQSVVGGTVLRRFSVHNVDGAKSASDKEDKEEKEEEEGEEGDVTVGCFRGVVVQYKAPSQISSTNISEAQTAAGEEQDKDRNKDKDKDKIRIKTQHSFC